MLIFYFLILIFTSCLLYIGLSIYQHNYWKRRGIPGPKGELLFGNLRSLIKHTYPRTKILQSWTKQYGKFYGINEGWRNVLVISDLDMVSELLIKKFECFYGRKLHPLNINMDENSITSITMTRGERWKRLRHITEPSLNNLSLTKMVPTIEYCAELMLENFAKHLASKNILKMRPHFDKFATDLICRLVFDDKDETKQLYIYELIMKFFNGHQSCFFSILANLFPWQWSIKIINDVKNRISTFFKNPMHELVILFKKEVEERRKTQMENDEKSSFIMDFWLKHEVSPESSDIGKQMSINEIIGLSLDIIATGSITTLPEICYYLAIYPDIQTKVLNEINEFIPNDEISFEQLINLKYMEAVFREVTRLNPSDAGSVSRECFQTTSLNGILIEKGTNLQVDVMSVHVDTTIWGDNALDFVPERWLENGLPHPVAWLSFGIGVRKCMGSRYAYVRDKIALIKFLKKYEIVECEATRKNSNLVGTIIMTMEAVYVKLMERNRECI